MQQQQSASYDLLAVFPDETKADSATAKLHKEGFRDEEVYQLSGSIGSGQYREHGPNRARSEVFLQTQRTGLGPVAVILLIIILGLLGAGLTFVATFALPPIHTVTAFLVGAVVGIVLGIILGLFQRARVRGNIGQRIQNQAIVSVSQSARTVVALRFVDPDNISRKSRARAILLNNQGKIDRSVGRHDRHE
jgi:hypothetical protein